MGEPHRDTMFAGCAANLPSPYDPMANLDYASTNIPPHLPGSMGAFEARRAQMAAAAGPIQQSFQPYEDNAGTVLGVSGKDYAVLACDSRMSRGYSILSRDVPKFTQLTDKCVIGSA